MSRYNIEELAEAIKAGKRAGLSRAITLVESNRPQDRNLALELMQKVQTEKSGNTSLRIGITGSPGAGKSTFIEAYGLSLVEAGKKVAVLAIDPSSSKTKGSILGDKTRMQRLAKQADAFIRPSPAQDMLGGVNRATRETILLCEAAGYHHIIIETVGVGQSEHAIKQLVDFMVLLVLPGSGDDLQGIKRGIVELADLVVINKADGDRIPLAKQTRQDYNHAIHFMRPNKEQWSPKAVLASAISPNGLDHFQSNLHKFEATQGRNAILQKRKQQSQDIYLKAVQQIGLEVLMQDEILQLTIAELKQELAANKLKLEQALPRIRTAIRKRLKP